MTDDERFETCLRTGAGDTGKHWDGFEVPASVNEMIDWEWRRLTDAKTEAHPEIVEIYANPAASPAMLADDDFNVVAWFVACVADEFARLNATRLQWLSTKVLRDPYTHKPFVHFYTTRAASVDRSPEGQDAQRLDRNDESAVPSEASADAPKQSLRNERNHREADNGKQASR